MKLIKIIVFPLFIFAPCFLFGQQNQNGFTIIPLGVEGGLNESNLSAYLVAAKDSPQFICIDAGTIRAGLQKAIDNKIFPNQDPGTLQKKLIHSYFISHGHLDHTAGLVLNAPNDSKKNIYAIPSVINVFKSSLFGSLSWSNFGNEGDKPIIGKYQYQYLRPEIEVEIPGMGLYVTPFVLSHIKPYESTAFLVRNQNAYLLYLGDTGPDAVEQSTQLAGLWKHIAPIIQAGNLKGIMIEVSFSNAVPDKALFGHLTPKWLMQEMQVLYNLTGPKLKETKIFITHIKPCQACANTIYKELQETNPLGLNFYFPKQAELIQLP